jgi:hypothetical protein
MAGAVRPERELHAVERRIVGIPQSAEGLVVPGLELRADAIECADDGAANHAGGRLLHFALRWSTIAEYTWTPSIGTRYAIESRSTLVTYFLERNHENVVGYRALGRGYRGFGGRLLDAST